MIKLTQLAGDGTWEIHLPPENVVAVRENKGGHSTLEGWTCVDVSDGGRGIESYEVRESAREISRLVFEALPLHPQVIAAKVAHVEAELVSFRREAAEFVEAAAGVQNFLRRAEQALSEAGKEIEKLSAAAEAQREAKCNPTT